MRTKFHDVPRRDSRGGPHGAQAQWERHVRDERGLGRDAEARNQLLRFNYRNAHQSRMCSNAPDNHAVVHNDFIRVGPGLYQLAI